MKAVAPLPLIVRDTFNKARIDDIFEMIMRHEYLAGMTFFFDVRWRWKEASVWVTMVAAICLEPSPSQAQQRQWRNVQNSAYQSFLVSEMQKSDSQFALRISLNNYVLEIFSNKQNQHVGHLVVFTSSYQEEDHNRIYSQGYFIDHVINADTARMISDLFAQLGIGSIPTREEIAGWESGFDGTTYTVETVITREYLKKTYWSPSVFKSIKEAAILDKFFSDISSLLQFETKWKSFLSVLPKGKTYRYGSTRLVTINERQAKGKMKSIMVTYRKADEPPVAGGMPEYKLTFDRDQSNLICTSYSVGKNRIALEDTVVHSTSLISTIIEWAKDKTSFTLKDLGVSRNDLGDTAVAKNYGLTFPMPDDLVINIDSISICKQHFLKRVVSTGGEHISVCISYDDHEEKFDFDNDNSFSTFDLKGYFICTAILGNTLPEEFPADSFFSKQTLVNLLYQYQKIVECEGYYYKEYTSKHPEFTPRDKRMMKGWDFKKYLKETGRTK